MTRVRISKHSGIGKHTLWNGRDINEKQANDGDLIEGPHAQHEDRLSVKSTTGQTHICILQSIITRISFIFATTQKMPSYLPNPPSHSQTLSNLFSYSFPLSLPAFLYYFGGDLDGNPVIYVLKIEIV